MSSAPPPRSPQRPVKQEHSAESSPDGHHLKQLPSDPAAPTTSTTVPPPPARPEEARATTDEYAPDLSAAGRVLGEDEHALIPKLGKVRCYWSLLTSDLEFLYLDPVLQHHMGPQHHSMLGTSLFSYLHPEELEQAKNDLKGIVDSGTLFGSVTRVRFARLPRIREILGCQNPEFSADADLIIADDHYLALDLVLNAAGEGLILAFFHAIVDKNEAQDRDEKKKSEWTNWCGTPFITTDMVKLLWDQVDTVPRLPQPIGPAFPPSRVFQVLMASSEHEVLLSHPPPREPDADRSIAKCDGGYVEEEFQKLLLEISLNPQGGSQFAEAKTTCTRRFRAKHTLLTEGCYRVIESVFIPYGTLIFACFQTVNQQWLPPPAGRPSVGLALPAPPYIDPALSSMHHQPQQQMPNSFPQPPLHAGGWANGAPPGMAPPHPGAYPGWHGHPPAPTHPYNQHPSAANYAPAPPHAYAHPPTAPMTDGYTHDRFESTSPTGSRTDSPPPRKKSPNPFAPSVPLVRPKKTQRGGSGGGSLSASGVPKDSTQLRNGGKPPKGIKECQSCGLRDSPEWRKGESGEKDLCNACGLRYARLVAKQLGKVRSRKKKSKTGEEGSAEESGSAPPGEDGAAPKKKKAKKEPKELPSDLGQLPSAGSGSSLNGVGGPGPSSSSQQQHRSPALLPPSGPPAPPHHQQQHHQHQQQHLPPPPLSRSPPRHPHPSSSYPGGGYAPPPHAYPPHQPPIHQHHQQHPQHSQPPQDYYPKPTHQTNAPPYHPRNPAPQQGYLPPQQQQQQQQQSVYGGGGNGYGGYPSYGGPPQDQNGGYYAPPPPLQQQHGAPYQQQQQQQQPYPGGYSGGGPVGGYPGPGGAQPGPRGGYESNGGGGGGEQPPR